MLNVIWVWVERLFDILWFTYAWNFLNYLHVFVFATAAIAYCTWSICFQQKSQQGVLLALSGTCYAAVVVLLRLVLVFKWPPLVVKRATWPQFSRFSACLLQLPKCWLIGHTDPEHWNSFCGTCQCHSSPLSKWIQRCDNDRHIL